MDNVQNSALTAKQFQAVFDVAFEDSVKRVRSSAFCINSVVFMLVAIFCLLALDAWLLDFHV